MNTNLGRWLLIAVMMVSGTLESAADEAKGKDTRAANDNRAKTDIKVKLAAPLDVEQKRTLSTSAVRLLRHVDDARKAVNAQDKSAALREIDQAVTLSKIIQKTAPKYTVNTTIQAGSVSYKDQDQIRGTLVTLYDELEKVSFIEPIESAKRQAAKVAQTGAPTAVTDVDVRRTRLLFDSAGTRPHLDAARQAVNKGDWNRADMALLGVQSGVIFQYVEADAPLMEARQNLMLAKVRLEDKQNKDARAALQKAAEVIENYAKAVPQARAAEAKEVAGQITNLAKRIDEDSADANKQIEGLWNKVTGWLG